MLGFQKHEIPMNIQELEFKKNTSCMKDFRSLIQKMRDDEESYTDAFSALIYMEEAANSTSVTKFNLEKVHIEIISRIDHKIKIKYDVSIQN